MFYYYCNLVFWHHATQYSSFYCLELSFCPIIQFPFNFILTSQKLICWYIIALCWKWNEPNKTLCGISNGPCMSFNVLFVIFSICRATGAFIGEAQAGKQRTCTMSCIIHIFLSCFKYLKFEERGGGLNNTY